MAVSPPKPYCHTNKRQMYGSQSTLTLHLILILKFALFYDGVGDFRSINLNGQPDNSKIFHDILRAETNQTAGGFTDTHLSSKPQPTILEETW